MDKVTNKTEIEQKGESVIINDDFEQKKSELLEELKEGDTPYFNSIDERLFSDKEIVLELAKVDGWTTLQHADRKFRFDKDVVLECSRENISSLEFASVEVLKERDFALTLVKIDGLALGHLKDFIEDEEIITTALSNNTLAIMYLSDERRNKITKERLIREGRLPKDI